jgi:Ca2+-binding RTX toxin-like protein
MQFPSRRARVALLAGTGLLAVAAPASADPTQAFDPATGKLTVNYAGTDTVVLGVENDNVKLGDDELTVAAADVKSIEVREAANGADANTVDLSGVTAKHYTALESTLIRAEGGNDIITGTQLDDVIEGGKGNDEMRGVDGDDTLIWRNGEGTDAMFGGDGIDLVENFGADTGSATVDEVYTVETLADGGFKFFRLPNPAVAAPGGGSFALNVKGAEKYTNHMLGGTDKFSTLDPTKPVTGIAVTIEGGEGDDTIKGTNGADTLKGDAGNDTLEGFKGNDAHLGGEGDDLMIWNPGDGSDKMDGEAGNDVAQDNGGAGVDHFVVTPQGQRVTATRDNVAPFFLDIGTTETLDVNANGGNDAVEIEQGIGTLIKVDANLGDGDDTIEARNDSADVIDGAAGADTAEVDATDQVTNVETVDAPVVETPDTTKPKVTIDSKNLKVRFGKAAVKVTCPAGESSCDGKIKIKRNGKVVGSIATKLVGGQSKTYQVQLKRSTRIALAKDADKTLPVKVIVTATDAAGNTAKTTKGAKLKG